MPNLTPGKLYFEICDELSHIGLELRQYQDKESNEIKWNIGQNVLNETLFRKDTF